MRVAHFVQRYPPAPGGAEAYFARLSQYLAAQGDDVTVFTTTALDLEAFWSRRGRTLPAEPEILEAHRVSASGADFPRASLARQAPNPQVLRFPMNARFRGRRYLLKALSLVPQPTWQCLTITCNPISWAMWRAAHTCAARFDLVHATAFPYAWPMVCGLRLARRQGIPFLLTPFLHLGDPDDPRDRTRRQYTTPALMSLVRAADRVFVQTGMERHALRARGVPGPRLVDLGMGVDAAECTGGARHRARRRWNMAPEEVVVGHLANNSVEKGTVDLLHAATRAWQRGSRLRLVLAGPQMPNFRRAWERFQGDPRVRCLGWLSDDEKRDFFAGNDILALPSRSDSFGLVLLEAWANGVPVVGYRAGGIADVIQHDRDGLLVRCGDLDELADALALLAAEGGLRQRLGASGRERTGREFRWEDKLRRVRQTYEESCGASRADRCPAF